MNRKRTDTVPQYDPDALKENARSVDGSIVRVREALNNLLEHNAQLGDRIKENNKNIQIFTVEIGKLEQEKAKVLDLAQKIEGLRSRGNIIG